MPAVDLHLRRSNRLLDDNFVYIKRDANQTKLVDNHDALIEQYTNCFYRNEYSAIDLCDGNMVSGLRVLIKCYLCSCSAPYGSRTLNFNWSRLLSVATVAVIYNELYVISRSHCTTARHSELQFAQSHHPSAAEPIRPINAHHLRSATTESAAGPLGWTAAAGTRQQQQHPPAERVRRHWLIAGQATHCHAWRS